MMLMMSDTKNATIHNGWVGKSVLSTLLWLSVFSFNNNPPFSFWTKYYFFKSIKTEKLLFLTVSAITQTISIESVTSLVDAVYTARILTVLSIEPDTFLKYYVKILVVCNNVLLNIVCFLTITWWIGWCIATYILLEIKFKKLNSYIIIITFSTIITHPACLTRK